LRIRKHRIEVTVRYRSLCFFLPHLKECAERHTFIFERAAEPGEWAVSGGFLFADCEPDSMEAKERHAFRSGFLGVDTLGFSTLAVIVEASEEDRVKAIAALAQRFLELGAPGAATADKAARDEVAFAISLCDHPEGTLLAVERRMEDGALRERFRTFKARERIAGADKMHASSRAFTFLEIEGDDDAPEERVDLVSLMGKKER
jgi:hypothetical protein